MDERASGIILRTRPLTETSLIVEWLTPEQGRIACVAKGARRPKSPFAGKLDLFYEADFSFMRSRKSELHTLREVSLRHTHPELRADLARLSVASYFTILIEQGTERETPIEDFYQLMQTAIDSLSRSTPGLAMVYGFELNFLLLSGLSPSFEALSTAAKSAMEKLATSELSATSDLEVSPPAARELSALFRRSIGMALGKLPVQRERAIERLGGS